MVRNTKRMRVKRKSTTKKRTRHENFRWRILMPDQVSDYSEFAYDLAMPESILRALGKVGKLS